MTTTYPRHWINLLDEAAAITVAPNLATDGVRMKFDNRPRLWVLKIRHSTTAHNDARTCKGRLYGLCPGEVDGDGVLITGGDGWVDTEDEFTVSASADGSVGITLRGLEIFTALYFRLTDITGVGTKISAAVTSYSAL